MIARNSTRVGLLFVDLDRFKAVNDSFGHGVGEKLLIQVAGRLGECLRGDDTLGRIGGDEFAVVVAHLTKPEDVSPVAQKILTVLEAPFNLDGHETQITASIGITLYPDDATDPLELFKNADTAMYRAKENGRNNYQFYLPEMNERLAERRQLERSLQPGV